MFYRSLFPRDVFAELDRIQRGLQQGGGDLSPSIRGSARGGYPALNVGSTARSVEIYAFAPGIDPATLDVQLEKGVLTIAGERAGVLPPKDAPATVHIDERFSGRFRRVVTLPDDVDPNAVEARYTDGVVHVSVQRKAASQPRRIHVQ
ncbi:MAG: Hsp20/alpha crystallin family protein [Zoogloea sp.]|uniref:Hsp20/alpha crystallin family protein n=1 Tax=Zoogloea sp. TaxID=49181 RepID=UPI00260C6FAE|nr:Hsp20/alpha crystallin family protein [Zoogloea sp.]MDD2989716.1 Hsp20/alpha crystallin family protein [Zoogloea sp.]